MTTVEQRKVGAILGKYFSGGSGPTHADIATAFGICGYQEIPETANGNKQNRVFEAFQKVDKEQAICLVRELLAMLLVGVDLDNLDQPEYENLMHAVGWAGLKIDDDRILGDMRVVPQQEFVSAPTGDDIMEHVPQRPRAQDAQVTSEKQFAPCKVFVSHSNSDSDLALQVARYLRTSCNLPEETILCTSAPNFGLPPGAGWSDAMRNALVNSELVVFLVSEDFLVSRFCGYEMGAVWIAKRAEQRFPIRLPGVGSDVLGSLAGEWQAPELSSFVLQQLAERVAELCELPAPRASSLSQQVDEFFPALA